MMFNHFYKNLQPLSQIVVIFQIFLKDLNFTYEFPFVTYENFYAGEKHLLVWACNFNPLDR